jgi:predicted dehydrogenase
MWAGPPKLDGTFDVEDYSAGFARFAGDATLSFEIAWAANAESESFVEILGDKGGARVGGTGPLVILTEHEGRVTDITPKYDESPKPFDVQARKFVAACRGEMAPVATIDQGCTVMKLIDAIYESSRKNREVPIE